MATPLAPTARTGHAVAEQWCVAWHQARQISALPTLLGPHRRCVTPSFMTIPAKPPDECPAGAEQAAGAFISQWT
jgi:hypothetical protein